MTTQTQFQATGYICCYLRTHPASGTFVTEGTSCYPRACNGNDKERLPNACAPAADIPVGRPDPEPFPIGRWRACVRRAIDCYPPHVGRELLMGYQCSGAPSLNGWRRPAA
jgi:hypothetical protein